MPRLVALEAFLKAHGVELREERTKLDVAERVGTGKREKRAADWSITVRVPRGFRVSAADITRMNELLRI